MMRRMLPRSLWALLFAAFLLTSCSFLQDEFFVADSGRPAARPVDGDAVPIASGRAG